jgi:hypothetical protein
MQKNILLIIILVICIILLFLMYRLGYVMGVNKVQTQPLTRF